MIQNIWTSPYTILILASALLLVGFLGRPSLPDWAISMIDNPLVRFIAVLAIIYLTGVNPSVGMLFAMFFIVLLYLSIERKIEQQHTPHIL